MGVAPYDALGDGWFTGMDPVNVKEFGWALEGEDRLAAELGHKNRRRREQVAVDPAAVLDDFDLPESDKKVLRREDWAELMREAWVEQTRNGVWGWVDDDLALVTPWGFDPAAITVPTQVWYGTHDVMVPPQHGEWLARTVPGAIVRLDERGHLGDPDADLVELFGWLTAS